MPDESTSSFGTLSPQKPRRSRSDAETFSVGDEPADKVVRALRVLDERESERYRVGAEIARGGFGRILRAVDLRLERDVAIKELLPHASPSARQRFEREAIVTSRLQHPSCIPVYDTGVWPNGTPFFAMKLVEGRSLHEILAATKDPAGRMALLPNVLAVADGLAYAHGNAILHRDLKPANVLVGAFGETVIIDWGLAKSLATADAGGDGEDDGAVDLEQSPLAPALTQAGAAVGTIGYMAPEQALGRPVDERADVYALGALLYHVLAGTPPVMARRLGDYVTALSQRLVPVAERAPAVPPDLAAIVDKATATDPAARYPSAGFFADDLRRFLAGQIVGAHRYSARELAGRFVKRNRAPLAVGAALLAVLAVSAVVSVRRIVHERTRAEVQRAAAEDLVGYVLYDLRRRLDALGKLALLEGVGEKVSGYYDAVERSGELDASSARRRAAALSVLADVSGAQGDAERSAQTRRAAIRLRDDLGAAATGDDVVATAKDLYALGGQLREHGALADARATIAAGLARIEGATDVGALRARAQGLYALGYIQYAEQGYTLALASEGTALAIATSLAVSLGGDAGLARETADIYARIGEFYEDRGDYGAAAAAHQNGLRVAEEVVAAHPDDLEARARVARGHIDLGTVLSSSSADGDGAVAVAMLNTGVAEERALAERDPANLNAQRELVTALSQLADHLTAARQVEAAVLHQREARAIIMRLVHADPGHDEWLRSLSLSNNKLADLARLERRYDEALALYQQGAALRAFLVTREPTNLRRQHDLATSFERIGVTLARMGRAADALASMEAALAQRARVLEAAPGSIDYQRGLSIAAMGVSEMQLEIGRFADARASAERALALRRGLVAALADNVGYRELLAEALHQRGAVALAEHDLASADRVVPEAAALRQGIADLAPGDPSPLAVALTSRLLSGDLELAHGDAAAAARTYHAVVARADKRLGEPPRSRRLEDVRASALAKLARL